MTIYSYLALKSVGDPQLSTDGRWVAYTIGTVSLQDNRTISRIWLAELATGQTRALTQGPGSDRSPRWAPDGKSLAFISARQGGPQIWVLPLSGGEAQKVSSLPDGVNEFVWTPDGAGFVAVSDGKWLSYLSMARPGFEADRVRLMLLPRAGGAPVEVTAGWTLSVGSYAWCPSAACIYAVVEERGRDNIYRIDLPSYRRTAVIFKDGVNTSLSLGPDGKSFVYLHQRNTTPNEVWTAGITAARQVSHVNDAALAQLDLPPLEEYGFVGAKGDSVFGWTLKPPAFDPAKKYHLVYLIHGGPQGAWTDSWSARWNYQMFASRGYVVAAVNFHGSTGYGQDFTDAISQHWGDYPYEDVMKGLDVVTRLPYVDSTKMCAAGASYGGYLVYWIAGHTQRFTCLIDHDGVFNTVSMAGSTEELWFAHWEFGGTLETSRALYEQWSPLNFVKNWKTPLLIVHSQLDYRVDLSEGYQAFTAAKRMGVTAKFLHFPDEGHWVLRPRNRRIWWGTVLDWLEVHLHERAHP